MDKSRVGEDKKALGLGFAIVSRQANIDYVERATVFPIQRLPPTVRDGGRILTFDTRSSRG